MSKVVRFGVAVIALIILLATAGSVEQQGEDGAALASLSADGVRGEFAPGDRLGLTGQESVAANPPDRHY